jgi:hypothetical protein
MKRFLAVAGLLILGASAAAHAQGTCTLKVAQVPSIGGLRLGMTPDEVLALFPGSREDGEVRAALSAPASGLGISGFFIQPQKYSSKAKFATASHITFTLLDGRISSLNVSYNGPEWKHVDQFVTKFSEGSKLPPASAWEAYVGMDTQLKTLKCRDFEISLFAGGKNVRNINYIEIRDMEAKRKLTERRAKAAEAKKAGQLILWPGPARQTGRP